MPDAVAQISKELEKAQAIRTSKGAEVRLAISGQSTEQQLTEAVDRTALGPDHVVRRLGSSQFWAVDPSGNLVELFKAK
jgi:hypothetical protein